jgi:hypothetical protein
MTKIKVVSLAMLAVLAVGAVSVSSASAFTSIEWIKAGTKNGTKGALKTGVTPTLTVPSLSSKVKCAGESSTGTLGGNKTMTAKITAVKFTGCKGENSKKETCAVKSPGAGAEEVVTKELSGELGESAQATSKVALNLTPTTGSEFVTLEGSCLPVSPSKVTGSIAGEATPLNTSQTTGETVFALNGAKQKITEVTLLGGTIDKPKLTAFIVEATQLTTEVITFEEATELHAA